MAVKGLYTTTVNLDHAPEIAKALGDMVVAWSSAEKGLITLLQVVTEAPYATCATTYYSMPAFDGRVRLIKNLLRLNCPQTPEVAALLKAVEGLRGLSGTRNGYIHGSWAICVAPKKETVMFDHLELPDTPGRRKVVKANDISVHAQAVARRGKEIRAALDAAFPPKPGKPPGAVPKRERRKTQKG